MILKTDGELEAFKLGISIGARLPMATVRALYAYIQLPFDTTDRNKLPWQVDTSKEDPSAKS